jgi:hypothetical protein
LQIWHLFGFSLLCVNICFLKSEAKVAAYPQSSHMCGLDRARTAAAAAATAAEGGGGGGGGTKGCVAGRMGVRLLMRKKNYDHLAIAAIDQSHASLQLHVEGARCRELQFEVAFTLLQAEVSCFCVDQSAMR